MKKLLILFLFLSYFAQGQQGNFNSIRLLNNGAGAGTTNGTIRFNTGSGLFEFRQGGSWVVLGAGFTNPMTTLGDIIYEDASPAAARLAGNITTTNKYLQQQGNGSISAAPSWNGLQAGDITTGLGFTPNNPANNGSDMANAGLTLQNLGAAASTMDVVTDAGASRTLTTADFPGANSGKFRYLKTTNASPHTIVVPNDATLVLPIGAIIYGQNDNSTLTFSATAPATMTGTSGNLLAPTNGFTWMLIKTVASTWELKNSGLGLGAANQMLGVDNAGTGQEYKTVSNGLTAASGTFKLGGALTADTQLSGAFSLGLGVSPTSKFHLQGLAAGTASMFKLQNSTPTTLLDILESGKTTWTTNVSGAAVVPYQWNATLTTSAPSQALSGAEFLFTPAGTDVATATATIFRVRNTSASADVINIDGTNAIATFNGTIFNFQNGTGTGTAVIRNNNSVLSVRGGVAGSTTSIDLRANSASSTTNHNTLLLTGTNFSITTALTRTHGTFQIDETTSSTNAGGIITNTTLNLIPTLSIASGTVTQTGINYAPTITAGTTTHYAMRLQSGLSALGQTNVPTAFADLAASVTASASLRMRSGTAPTSPNDGDHWYDGTNYFVQSTSTYTLAKTLTATATLDFASTLAGAATDLTITVTGAASGDVVAIGVPNGSTLTDGNFTGWVSAANTVTVRFANNSLTLALDPASGTFRASVLKY